MSEKKEEQKCPCPVCGHEQSSVAYYAKKGRAKDEGVPCEMCGAEIAVQVPLHALCAIPYGWKWVRVYKEREVVTNHVVERLYKVIEVKDVPAPLIFEPTRALFRALNGLTVMEVETFFQHPIIKYVFGVEAANGLQDAYAKYRTGSDLVQNE